MTARIPVASADAAHAARLAAIRAGDRRAIGRALSAIENGLAEGARVLDDLAGLKGRAHVVGITGAPGAGKSTLISALLRECTERRLRVAVVAVDPSSPLTGGAVLGDRVRMGETAADERVFVRSIAARGHHGGIAATTSGIVDLLDAAGFDVVIVETVGAGQSEVEIAAIADTRIVVCAPGLGDEVQAIKAGILEIADVLVVSKGDSPLAERTMRDLADMLKLRRPGGAWEVPVLLTTATEARGIGALVDAWTAHAAQAGRGRRLRHAETASPGKAPALANRLHGRDAFMRHCGVALAEAGPGRATLTMTVGPEHLNFNGSCHGGALFALADGAFGLASNVDGVVAAGIDAHIAYHVAVRSGDTLTARAVEVSRRTRVATYRIDVTRQDGVAVASFTGTVYLTARSHDAGAPA